MAAFSSEEEDSGRWDYELMSEGAVAGFRDGAHLDLVVSQLRDLGYGIAATRGGTRYWLLRRLLEQVSMQYPDWSTGNLDALRDTLRGIHFAGVTGWVLVWRQFDAAYDADPTWAHDIVDIIAQVSYEHLLRGNRLLVLLQSDNRELDLGRLGGHKPWWHGAHRQ